MAMEEPVFTCNICGASNACRVEELQRENSSCSSCGSNVRTRGILHVLSMELFGVSMTLPEFPRVKSLRGIGTSDDGQYANRLMEKFDYRNTFYHRQPRFDLTNPAEEEFGQYDFVISSEVLEHVPPPADAAMQTLFRLLKPTGVLILTVPYSVEATTAEHFPDLHQYGIAQVAGHTVLVNRTRDGRMQVFENLVFHGGWNGPALEMREFTETGLKAVLAAAGFSQVRINGEDYRPFGIVNAVSWSLPIAARKERFGFSFDATRDVLEEWRDLKRKFNGEMKRLDRNFWFRLGRKIGFL
jgi:SAM-dependent methyltransferase